MKIVSPSSLEYRPIADLTEPSKREYANFWGCSCEFPVHDGPPDDMMWQRIQFMLDGLESVEPQDWILWMGADTIITDLKRGWQSFVHPAAADLIVAVDMNGLQSDVMLIRSNGATKDWLRMVLSCRRWVRCEQDAMSMVLGSRVDYGDYRRAFHSLEPKLGLERSHERLLNCSPVRVGIAVKAEFNATVEDWMPGAFVFHAAGMPLNEERLQLIKSKCT